MILSSGKLHLRQTHPNFFLGLILWGIWGVIIGLMLNYFAPHTPYVVMSHILGTAYVAAGTMKIVGALVNVPLGRFGMLFCIVLSTAFSFSIFAAGISRYNVDPEIGVTYFLFGITTLFYGGLTQFAPLREQPINPMMMKSARKDER